MKILDRLIEIEPSKRYQHAEDVIKDLECLNTVIKIDAVVGEYTRSIVTGHDKHEVGGIILREPNHKELVRIAKASVLLVEERWQGKRTGNGSGFLYKQVIMPEKHRSRCYFRSCKIPLTSGAPLSLRERGPGLGLKNQIDLLYKPLSKELKKAMNFSVGYKCS